MTLAQMILSSGFFVQLVLVALLFASVYSWAIAFKKYKELKNLGLANDEFINFYRETKKLSDIYQTAKNSETKTCSYIFQKGYEEFLKVNEMKALSSKDFSFQDYFSNSGVGSIKRALNIATSEIIAGLERYLTVLATVGAICPFLGLFGTVWGIINSFMGLAEGGTTLDAIAPGVAEALITTAVGLIAAIPAVIFYNYFSNKITQMQTNMNSFSLEFLNMVERIWPTIGK